MWVLRERRVKDGVMVFGLGNEKNGAVIFWGEDCRGVG